MADIQEAVILVVVAIAEEVTLDHHIRTEEEEMVEAIEIIHMAENKGTMAEEVMEVITNQEEEVVTHMVAVIHMAVATHMVVDAVAIINMEVAAMIIREEKNIMVAHLVDQEVIKLVKKVINIVVVNMEASKI